MKKGIIQPILASVFFLICCGVLVYVYFKPLNTEQLKPHETQPAKVALAPKEFSFYTWSDLHEISDIIADAQSDDDVQAIARKFNLITSDGKLTDQSIPVQTKDNRQFAMRLVGINQDKGAHLSFVSTEAVEYKPMRKDGSNKGGWQNSDLRAWLQGDFFKTLPDDLSQVIKPVEKKTNNSDANYNDAGSIQTTEDTIWLLSASEICGPINWYTKDDPYYNEGLNKTLSKQGEQYQYFKDMGVKPKSDPHQILQRNLEGQPVNWWMRSPYLFSYGFMKTSYTYAVMQSGYPFTFFKPDTKQGVVIGFAL